MPTIFDYLGLDDLCDGCRGRSLLPLLRESSDANDVGATVPSMRMITVDFYRPWKESRGDVNVVLRQRQWKGIWNDELDFLELYNLETDPLEKSDVSASHAEIAGSLGGQGKEWLADCRRRAKSTDDMGEVDLETQEQLRSLGYFN